MLIETQAEFARRKSVSKKTVTQWKAKGLLSMTPEGKVKVEESEWLLADRPAVYRGGRTKGSAPSQTHEPGSAAETPQAIAERVVVREGHAPYELAEAVRIKENYLALMRQLEYERESGKLVAIEDVARAQALQSARVRTKILGQGALLAARLAVMRDPEEIKALLDEEAHRTCQELSIAGFADISADDIRPASGLAA